MRIHSSKAVSQRAKPLPLLHRIVSTLETKRVPYTRPYTHGELRAVWRRSGRILPCRKPSEWREDAFGSRIRFEDYGDRNSDFGWEVDHIIRIADGGSNHVNNLRPLQWENNVKRNTPGR